MPAWSIGGVEDLVAFANRVSRRSLLLAGGGAIGGMALRPRGVGAASGDLEKRFVAAPGQASLSGPSYPETAVWAYNGQTPGPQARLRQGGHLRIVVENQLPQDTTIHWHGLRVPNVMDGAPYVTQPPIQPNESFTYEFIVPDAGTYWHHPPPHIPDQAGPAFIGAFMSAPPNP